MVPDKSDPRWAGFLANLGSMRIVNLPTKMFVNGLKVKLILDKSEAMKLKVIDAAHEYFVKNEPCLKDEIKAIFH